MNLLGFDFNWTWAMFAAGIAVGWHFPQPVWVGATFDAIKTWFAGLKK